MARWNATVNFRDLLEVFNNDADELEEIKRVMPLWTERFNSIPQLKHFAEEFEAVRTIAELDSVLHRVYDYCDERRIWVELD